MLTIRPRGKHGTLYIRGTVTLGNKCIIVAEYSSGTRDRDAASHLMHLGGWKSLRMVQRYVGLSVDHLKDAINKLD